MLLLMIIAGAGGAKAEEMTWDLSTNSYSSADKNNVTWSSDNVSMVLAKSESSTNANNYLGGGNNAHTRMYASQTLTWTPLAGTSITSITIETTGSTVSNLTESTWENATASSANVNVTVTPTDGSHPISCTIKKAIRVTKVNVVYSTTGDTPEQQIVTGYSIDFENIPSAYTDWTMTNVEQKTADITAHGGTYYGTTGGKATASIQTKEKIANPGLFTCYISKVTANTTTSTWYVQVSSDGQNWTDVRTASATNMSKGSWNEVTANLDGYSDVYVRLYYNGSTAVRAVDDISLKMSSSVKIPVISLEPGSYFEAKSVTIECATDGATIYYTLDGSEPTAESTEYTGAISISETTTLRAIAIKDGQSSNVVSATYTFPVTYNDIAALIAAAPTETVILKLENAQVLYVNNKDMYVMDATGALDFYNCGLDYEAGKILNGTMAVTYTLYNNLPEIASVDSEHSSVTASDGTAVPVEMSAKDITLENDLCKLVKVKGEYADKAINNVPVYNKWKLESIDLDNFSAYIATAVGIVVPYKDAPEIALISLEEVPMVAQIGDNKYETFAEAVAAATEGQTITLLADIEDDYELAEGQTLKLDKNGHSINVVVPKGFVLEESVEEGVTTYSSFAGILINNVEELKAFRDAVNNKTSYAGKTVKLTADLDLSGEENWEPIGDVAAYPSKSFKGIFDGGGHTISNLTIDDQTVNWGRAALFGSISNGTIKNLNITDVDIKSHHYASAIVAYKGDDTNVTVSNCHVKNGSIVSTPELLSSGSYDNGDKVGAILGYGANPTTIDGCSAENINIGGYRDLGSIAGFVNGTVTNCTAKDVTIVQDNKNGYKTGDMLTTCGEIVGGRSANAATVNSESTHENVVIQQTGLVAQVGDVKFKTFAEAVAALTEENNTITLLANIEEAYTLAEGQTLNVIRGEYTLTVLAPDGNILQTAEADGVTTYSYAAPVAKIDETMYASLQEAIDDAEEGETVKLLKDIELEQTETVDGVKKYGARVEKSIIIDGDGHKLSGNANRTIGIKGTNSSNKINVTIKNLNIENAQNGGGAIFTRGNLNSLTLNNVNLILTSTGGGYNQPLTISGNAGNDETNNIVEVKLDGCTLESAPNCEYGYAIINWVPANVEIKNSVIKGWACLYAKPNSKGTTYTVEESELISSNQNAGDWNSFGVIVLEDKDITVNVTNTKIDVSGTKNTQSIATFNNYWATASNNSTAGSTVTLGEGNTIIMKDDAQFTVGSVNDGDENGGKLIISGGIFDKPVPEQYCAEGMIPVDLGDGKYGVKRYISAPIIFHDEGTYEDALTVAMAGEGTIKYQLNGDAEQTFTYTAPFTISETTTVKAWTEQDGAKSDEVEKTFTIVEKTYDGDTFDGYYTIKNNGGNNMFVNVAGRKTVTFESETADKAGTVIRVKTNDKGQVEVLRSQGVDVPGYAEKAMRYVPEIVKLVVNKLNNLGEGQLMGEAGLEALMKKFNEAFDEHLYLEQAGENSYRIYGRTPSMKHVVDFYAENKANVDAKLPMLEGKINAAIEKVLEKTEGRGKSILVPFSLETVWQNMGGTLTKPVDEASTMKFYEEVLTSDTTVWNFAYQTAMIYWGNLKNNGTFQTYIGKLGDYAKYINKVENIRPNFKYYIVQKDGKMDIISEGNEDIVKNNANTIWTLEDRTEFSVAFNEENVLNDKYYTTLYTDFAYTLPEGVKAYKVTEVSKAGVAKKVEMEGTIPAQTPVLLESESAEPQTLLLSTEDGTAPTDNLLVGADSLINQYQIKTAQVESLFNLAKDILGKEFYDNYVAEYEHLMLRYAGTVNNKYFFGLSKDDLNLCTYKNENDEDDCVVRSLSMGDEKLGFYNNWTAKANEAFLVSEQFNPVKLTLKGDVNRSGDVTVADVNALVEIVLGKVTEADNTKNYDFEAAHVNADEEITIADVTALVNIILGKTQN